MKTVVDSRLFRRGALAYLKDEDRFLSAREEPLFSYGVIGCGIMGQEHIHNTLLLGRARIAGVYDPAPESVRHALRVFERRGGDETPKVYDSLADACADPATDALIVATPNYTHLDVLRDVVGSGKAIFLEKPIATTVADAYEVCRLANAHDAVVRFGLQYRYKAIYAEAIDEVFRRGSIGRVHNLTMAEHRFPFLDKVGQWNKFNAKTGGTLVEKCCHYFDLMNLFSGGEPKRVFALGDQAVNFTNFTYDNQRADGLDHAQVTIEYTTGVIGGFSLCMFAPGTREELTICGDAGRLHVSEQAMVGEENVNHVEVWSGENGTSRTSTPTYPSYIASAGHHGSTFFEHVDFAADLEAGRNSGPGPAAGFWSVVAGATAQASIERGEAVDVAEILPENFDPAAIAEGAEGDLS